MRYQAFAGDSPLDKQAVPFPWNDAVTFHIWRSGRREYAGEGSDTTGNYIKLLRIVARKKKLTLKQLREMENIDLQAEIDGLELDEALEGAGAEGVMRNAAPDRERVARYLVDRVDGPLILADDSDAVLGWHDPCGDEVPHCGVAFLDANPDVFTIWLVGEANRIEAEFLAFMAAASGNSPASSDSGEAEEATPDS